MTKQVKSKNQHAPNYGDLTALNACRLILDTVGKATLEEIAKNYIDLVETSGAIYELNGDYALTVFSSGWCQYLDNASRHLCPTEDNGEALGCGKWVCHESCWQEASLESINTGTPVDIECKGGIRLYAVPIFVDGKVVGSLNVGYGTPPFDPEKLKEIANRYHVEVETLTKLSREYIPRPPEIIQNAKAQLHTASKLIGLAIERKLKEEVLLANEEKRRVMAQYANIGQWEVDLTNNTVWWDESYDILFGDRPKDTNKSWQWWIERIHPEDRDRTVKSLEEAISASGDFWQCHYRFRTLTEEYFHILDKAMIYRSGNGEAVKVFGVMMDITELKTVEQQLKIQKKLLDRSQEIAHLGSWHLDIKKNILTWSDENYRVFGRSKDKFEGTYEAFLDTVHSEDREMVDRTYTTAIKNNLPYECIHRIVRDDGATRFVHEKSEDIVDENGETIHSIGFTQDITERVQAEEALRQSEERFELAMQFANDGLYDWDLSTNQIYYSPGWKKMLGYEDHEIKNDFSEWERLTQPEDVSASWIMLKEVIAGKRERFEKEFQMRHKDGHWVDILSRANIVFDDDGEAVRVVGTHVDITKIKQVEREQKRNLDAIENSLNGFDIVNQDGLFTYVNKAYIDMWGYEEADEIIGTSPVNHCLDPTIPERIIRTLKEKGECEIEFTAQRRDGSTFEVLMYSRLAYDDTGHEIYPTTSIDITSKKKAAEEHCCPVKKIDTA